MVEHTAPTDRHVRTRIDWAREHLLRRHVERRADADALPVATTGPARARASAVRIFSRDPEVEDLEHARAGLGPGRAVEEVSSGLMAVNEPCVAHDRESRERLLDDVDPSASGKRPRSRTSAFNVAPSKSSVMR